MKKLLRNITLVCLAVLTVATIACKKENDEAPVKKKIVVSDASDIAGTYVGTLTMYLQEMPAFELPTIPMAEFEITAEEGGTISIAIPSIAYNLNGREMVLPAVEQGGITVEKENDSCYTISETSINQVVNEKSYTGSIKGSISGGILTLNFSLKYGNMPMTLIFTFVSSPQHSVAPAHAVANSYMGTINMSVEGSEMEFAPVDSAIVTIVANGDSIVSVVIPDVTYTIGGNQRNMEGFTLSGVVVRRNATGYQLVETDINQTVGQSEYVGTLSGSVVDGKLGLNYVVKPGRMPMNIVFEFVTNE